MKTKDIPAIVTLSAGAVYCLIGIRDGVELMTFTCNLLIILLIFYMFGGIIKVVLDKLIAKHADPPEDEEAQEESEEKTAEDEEDVEEEVEEESAE